MRAIDRAVDRAVGRAIGRVSCSSRNDMSASSLVTPGRVSCAAYFLVPLTGSKFQLI